MGCIGTLLRSFLIARGIKFVRDRMARSGSRGTPQ